jgi:hypothetical protein
MMSATQCAQRARDLTLTGAAFVLGGDDGAEERRRLLYAAIDDLDRLPVAVRRQVLRRMALTPAVTPWTARLAGGRVAGGVRRRRHRPPTGEGRLMEIQAGGVSSDLVPNAAGCARRASAAV